MADLLYEAEVFKIRGVIFNVHNEMGSGFLEAVYQECLEREFERLHIPFVSRQPLTISFRGEPLAQTYQPDLVCFGKIILELKATSEVAQVHRAQLLNYLKATGLKLGLLVNFGAYPKVQIERLAL